VGDVGDLIKVKVRIFGREERLLSLPRGSTIEGLLKALSLNPVEVVATRNGEVVTEDEILEEGDEVELYSVVSGG